MMTDYAKNNLILALYLRLGALLLSVSASAYEVFLSFQQIAQRYSLPIASLLPFPNSLNVSFEEKNLFYSATHCFEVAPLNAGFLARVEKLLFTNKTINIEGVETLLQQILILYQHPLRHWLLGLLMCVIQCVATCKFFGGDLPACVATAFAACVSFLAFRYFNRGKLNLLLLEVMVAFLASFVAVVVNYFWPTHTALSMLFASIIWLVPGILMMDSFSDLFHGFINSALHNFTKAWMVIFALLLGLTPALLYLPTSAVAIAISPHTDWLWAGIASLACAYRFEAIGKLLGWGFFLGALGHGFRAVLVVHFAYDPVSATFLAASAVGIAVAILFWRNPLLIVYAATIGIIPLVPGAALLRAFYELLHIAMQGINTSPWQLSQGFGLMTQAIVEVMALAIGGILPTTLWRWIYQRGMDSISDVKPIG